MSYCYTALLLVSFVDRFVTGDWDAGGVASKGEGDGEGVDDDEEVYGDFEDLQTG